MPKHARKSDVQSPCTRRASGKKRRRDAVDQASTVRDTSHLAKLRASCTPLASQDCTNLSTGIYNLDSHTFVILHRNALQPRSEGWEEILAYLRHEVKKTPNPRNPNTFLRRKQCTFVEPDASSYEFGQFNETIRSEANAWPSVVKMALHMAQELASTVLHVDASLYNGVHANLYPSGDVGVLPHYDKEQSLVEGMPIFSFTLLSDPDRPRPFSIYTLEGVKLYDILLGQGDLLIMCGAMQKRFKHGVEAAKPPARFKDLIRINLTVRAFRRVS